MRFLHVSTSLCHPQGELITLLSYLSTIAALAAIVLISTIVLLSTTEARAAIVLV